MQVPGPERASFLAEVCGEDGALRDRIEALLKAHLALGHFLERPALPAADRTVANSAPLPPETPDKIGGYQLLEQIGEGGWGVVYMAEQQEPMRRRVAVKVVKLGMETKQVIARFEAERQALALMDHPNIAKVLEAGTTAAGRPYFVMELGPTVARLCSRDSGGGATRQSDALLHRAGSRLKRYHQPNTETGGLLDRFDSLILIAPAAFHVIGHFTGVGLRVLCMG